MLPETGRSSIPVESRGQGPMSLPSKQRLVLIQGAWSLMWPTVQMPNIFAPASEPCPTLAQQEEVALPSHGQFRQPCGAETQLHFVAGTQDHHAVVRLRQQLLHRAVACVIAGGRVPHRSGAHAGVIEPLRLLRSEEH